MQGKLFTQDFLREGIRETDAWQRLDPADLARFRARIAAIFGAFPADSQANEAVTETEIIFPVLEALGWASLPQQTASGKGRQDVADVLLFADATAKQAALAERYRRGAAIVECKRWQRPLDRGDRTDPLDANAPSNQMLRYLSRAEVASERAIQWGLLTNGRYWRLYFQGARSRSEEFLELDLARLAGMKGLPADLFDPADQDAAHFLAVFYLLFGPAGFIPQPEDPENRAFLAIALAETRRWEARVSQDLGALVFERLFPRLVAAMAQHDPAASAPHSAEDYLDTVRREALILLYRLLFVLYAEDRNLLPIRDPRYNHYSLRVIRQKIARHLDANAVFSASAGRCYRSLKDLFQIIGQGDAALGVPPYNGGLFDDRAHALLERLTLPDAVVAELIDGLSRRPVGSERRWINYRDLSVQQLGSIYERLLEYRVVGDGAGQIRVSPTIFARKGSGSYYTHDDLVQLLIRQTVGPLLAERAEAFERQVEALARLRSPKPQRLRDLQDHDPAAAILELKICDPAMGSGHFLVSLVDYLADQILERMADSTARVHWADPAEPYVSPLARRIADIRERILASSQAQGWTVDPAQLDDRHIVRRMILKRVIFGVDKNPMAVELAKVALWLHTFTVG
ncbi:MAG: restriction endonuclease, partial [Candidatus Competibacteraceae bacterium]